MVSKEFEQQPGPAIASFGAEMKLKRGVIMKSEFSSPKGFTLIELMIVVVIIGILAAMAIPRFMQSTTQTKQSEAKLVLKQIYVNERTYRQQSTTNSYYIPGAAASAANPDEFKSIWIEIMATAAYTYTIAGAADVFTATATANIDDDATLDIWTMDHDGVLTNVAGNNDVID